MKKLWIVFFVALLAQAECPQWNSSAVLSQDCQILIPKILQECSDGVEAVEDIKEILKSILEGSKIGAWCPGGQEFEEIAELCSGATETFEECSGSASQSSCDYFCSPTTGICYNQGADAFVDEVGQLCQRHTDNVNVIEETAKKNAEKLLQLCNPVP